MREAIGGTWLFGLVITFIVFFASFLAVSINYSKAFNVKNNIVDLLSKYEGNNSAARQKIGDYLSDVGYLVTGRCEEGYTGYNLDGEAVGAGQKAYFCVACDKVERTANLDKQYYRAVVFFKIDLPLVGELTNFKIKGETEAIPFPTNEPENFCD